MKGQYINWSNNLKKILHSCVESHCIIGTNISAEAWSNYLQINVITVSKMTSEIIFQDTDEISDNSDVETLSGSDPDISLEQRISWVMYVAALWKILVMGKVYGLRCKYRVPN